MKRFIEGVNRTQSTLFPESLEDYIAEDNPVRVFDDPRQAEMAAGKSMVRLADEFPTLQKDELAFKKKFETCVSILKTAERKLRPRMDETMKTLVPELFSKDQQ